MLFRSGQAMTDVPGVDSREEGRLLPAPATASPVDAGLREYWEHRLDETAGWSLTTTGTENGDPVVLGDKAPEESDPIRTTMDLGAQAAAQRAVDSEDNAASFVAISASTGGVLAVGQNDAANAQGTPALTGLFPPGVDVQDRDHLCRVGPGNRHPGRRGGMPGLGRGRRPRDPQ